MRISPYLPSVLHCRTLLRVDTLHSEGWRGTLADPRDGQSKIQTQPFTRQETYQLPIKQFRSLSLLKVQMFDVQRSIQSSPSHRAPQLLAYQPLSNLVQPAGWPFVLVLGLHATREPHDQPHDFDA